MSNSNNQADSNSLFANNQLKDNLKERSIRGASVTLFGQSLKFVLNIVSTMILARILTPQDFGVIAMVWAIVAFAYMFKDLGLSMATVQQEFINHSQISNLFWINVCFGLVITLFFVCISPIVASFYGEEKLLLVTITLSVTYTFSGLAAQHQALLKRNMRFTALSVVEVVSIAFGIIAAIVSALLSAGYWALIIKELGVSFSRTFLIWYLCKWHPDLPNFKVNVLRMLRFGANLSLFNILNYFARNIDNVLIGKFLGAASLGFYSKAYQLLLLPLNQINVPIANVAIPCMSRLQFDKREYCNYYCKAINIACSISMPLVVTLAVLSDETILILLGEQWHEAADIFKILSITAFVQTISQTSGWIFISLGQTERMLKWAMISVPLTIISFLVGLPWGIYGVAVSYTIINYILIVPQFIYTFKKSPITMNLFINAIWKPVTISLLIGVMMSITHIFMDKMSMFITVSTTLISGIIMMQLAILIIPGAKAEVHSLFEVIIALTKGLDKFKPADQKISSLK